MIQACLARAGHQHPASWEIAPVTREGAADVERLFLRLHRYNAGLDPRFALAEDWQRHFAACVEGALAGRDHLALLARDGGQPVGFLLAAVHRDSPLWRHREWAEVDALCVEHPWRGTGLAAVQLYVTASNTRATSFYERQGFRPAQAVMRAMLPAGAPRRGSATG